MKLAAALLLFAAIPAQAAGLTVRSGETWFFTVKDGEPANARRVSASAKIPKGQIKVAVRPLLVAPWNCVTTILTLSRIVVH